MSHAFRVFTNGSFVSGGPKVDLCPTTPSHTYRNTRRKPNPNAPT
ncbi:hypothetical protein ACQP1G_10650 [Nocardia sp. CA-107356]